MSLLEEARALETRAGPRCGGKRLEMEFPELAEEVKKAVAAGVQQTALITALNDRPGGEDISVDLLRRHFIRKRCKCWGANGHAG